MYTYKMFSFVFRSSSIFKRSLLYTLFFPKCVECWDKTEQYNNKGGDIQVRKHRHIT